MTKELYTKSQQGARTRYIPYSPQIDDMELTDAQVVTIVGAAMTMSKGAVRL